MDLLTLTLDLPLPPWQMVQLRAAVVQRVGLEHELFHMHNNDPAVRSNNHQHYPLIQYGVPWGRVQITGVNSGAEAIRYALLPKLQPNWDINGQSFVVPEYRVRQQTFDLTIGTTQHTFGLYQWLALRKKNFEAWRAAEHNDTARQHILDQALTGHLRAMAEGLGFPYHKIIEGRVRQVLSVQKVSWKRVPMVAFHVIAESNLNVPEGLGLGRLGAYGFGAITRADHLKERIQRRQTTGSHYLKHK